MADPGNELEEIRGEATTYGRWALSSLFDGVFLVLWILIQWGVQQVFRQFPLDGIDRLVRDACQFVFAVATLIPIALHFLRDISILAIRAYRDVRRELKEPPDGTP